MALTRLALRLARKVIDIETLVSSAWFWTAVLTMSAILGVVVGLGYEWAWLTRFVRTPFEIVGSGSMVPKVSPNPVLEELIRASVDVELKEFPDNREVFRRSREKFVQVYLPDDTIIGIPKRYSNSDQEPSIFISPACKSMKSGVFVAIEGPGVLLSAGTISRMEWLDLICKTCSPGDKECLPCSPELEEKVLCLDQLR